MSDEGKTDASDSKDNSDVVDALEDYNIKAVATSESYSGWGINLARSKELGEITPEDITVLYGDNAVSKDPYSNQEYENT